MTVMDLHPLVYQSTHVPNVTAITFLKLMEFHWVDEFDDLDLVGFLTELAPHGTHEQRAGHH